MQFYKIAVSLTRPHFAVTSSVTKFLLGSKGCQKRGINSLMLKALFSGGVGECDEVYQKTVVFGVSLSK
jgi:hypothetical protein